MKLWIRNVQPRLNTTESSYGDARALENQLGRSQVNSSYKNRKKFTLTFIGCST